MKFTFIFIGVMLLRGIELHRHMNQHGQKKHKTDPHTESEKDYDVELNEKDELNRIDELDHLNEAVHKRHHVHATEVQTDIRSSPGDNIENDGTKMAQDSKITPKPGIRRNKLVAKYGTNFRYLGIVKNGIDRVTVVTSIPIPRYENVKVKPINFAKCAIALGKDDKNRKYIETPDTRASKAAKEWCARAIPYIEYLKEQEKYYIEKVHELMCDDLYAALPELKPTSGHLKSRNRRGIGALILSAIPGLITLAVESIGSWIKGKQQRRVDEAVSAMRAESQVDRNKLRQYSNDFLMYGKYNVDTLQNVIDTVNAMHRRQTELEKQASGRAFGDTDRLVESMKFGFDLQFYMKVSDDEHVKQLQVLERASKEVIRGITVLSQGRLPQEFFSDSRLKEILNEVQKMVQKGHPTYALAAEHISHYRDMKLVTFAVDQQTHSLIVTFPVFIQDFRRPPLSLFEIETVPVPIPDKNVKADSYTQVQIGKPYIAVGSEYYIELRMTEMIMCRSIRFNYYCEELFVVKHKSAHGCSSAIFYDMGATRVTEVCEFKYMYNATVAPTILDGGKELLLANFHGPRSLKCDSEDGGLAKPAPEHTYAVVNREFLCDCQLDLEYASILKQISACGDKTHYDLTLRFTVNLAFWQMLKQYKPNLAKTVMPNMNRIEQTFPVKLFENVKGPLQMPTALTDIVKRLDDEGKKSKQTDTRNTPIFSRYESNIMTIVSGGLACICAAVILILIVKQTRLQSLVSSLGLVSLIPSAKALYFTEIPKATNVPYFLARNVPDEKVVCSHPLLTAVGSAIAIGGALYAAYQVFRSLSWYRGYRNSRCCTMYFFLYHDDFYAPLKIKSLSGHIHMYKMENKLTPGQLTLQRNCLWDTVTIDWENVQILKHDEPVAMPVTVTVPLSHKIKTRNILNTEYEIQVTLKKGNDWINITQWTTKKRGHVKAMCDVLENK